MAFRIYVSGAQPQVRAALCDENKLLEYSVLNAEPELVPGTVVLGCIREVVPSLGAAFVEIGAERPAFLPLDGRPLESFRPGRELPVQIKKIPHEEKGAAVSDRPELCGKLLILLCGETAYGVSQKITDPSARERLKAWADSMLKDKNACFIVRTEAERALAPELELEAEKLIDDAEEMHRAAEFRAVGTVLYRPASPWKEWTDRQEIEEIVCDRRELKHTIEQELPALCGRIRLCEESRFDLMDLFRVSAQLTKAKNRFLNLEGGGSIVIEETTALVAIDVNSGKGHGPSKENSVLSTNKKAARLIMEQLRLRNLGGIVLIDFINMREEESRQELLAAMQELAALDPVPVKIYGYTALGLLEMTRERRGTPLSSLL